LKPKDFLFLALLTILAFLVIGYHPGAEDAEIYLPGVEKLINPQLFPSYSEFFQSHAHLTLFPNLIAACVRISHLSLDGVLLIWELASIFLLLLACWKLSGLCFQSVHARWAGVSLVAALLSLPVAGTALYIIDQYTNPRNIAAFGAVFAVCAVLERKYAVMTLWLAFAAAVHPLMAAFAFFLCGLLILMERTQLWGAAASLLVLPHLGPRLGLHMGWFAPASPAYHQAALLHSFHYLLKWQWYEWLGIFAPIAIFFWFGRMAGRVEPQGSANLLRLCRALIIYDVLSFLAALVISAPARFEVLARLQPLRSLHLLYIILFVLIGGYLGQFVLQKHVWRWLVLFVPLCAGMFMAQRALFPASDHIEWTRASSRNPWAQAFQWVAANTPEDAVFALDPNYAQLPGEDAHGFRAIAQRSMIADAGKDSGAVSMFPPLAEEWYEQVQARRDWKHFAQKDFARLQSIYGISWVIISQPGVTNLHCPYENQAVLVCELR
jgi:hypothetical protein